MTDINLVGRMARCTCGAERSSDSKGLAFFEYRGEGSRYATETCRQCGYALLAHGPDAPVWSNGKTAVQNASCPGFEPTGGAEFDTYYCGHAGWD